MNKREEQNEERRNKILEVSLNLFVEKGFAGTKISDISAAANMSAGLFFHYFESKEQVYKELVEMGLGGTQNSMQIQFDDPINFFECVTDWIFSSINLNRNVAKMFVLMANAQIDKGTPEHIREIALKVNNISESVKLIEKGQKSGSIRQGNPIELSIAFWCAIQGIATFAAINPDAPCPKAEWIVDILRA